MSDESYTFGQARVRLEEIVSQVRKRDTGLERSLDLLEEGVRLANICTEASDHTEWRNVIEEQRAGVGEASSAGEFGAEEATGDAEEASGEPGHAREDDAEPAAGDDAADEPFDDAADEPAPDDASGDEAEAAG